MDPRKLTSLTDILACTSGYHTEEELLTFSLTELLKNKKAVADSIKEVNTLTSCLEGIRLEGHMLNNTVINTAKTAARIGQYVRVIEEEMGRVRTAREHVAQAMDLRTSFQALQTSIENHDWEAATTHCALAMSVPEEILLGPFAEAIVPNASQHLPPPQLLRTFREQLLATFIDSFQHASRTRDSAATTRFFKMFPAIGCEKEGLEIYSRFIAELIRVRTSTGMNAISSQYYTTAIAILLENIAIVVHQHQPVIDKYYGRGKIELILENLMHECDQMVENLLDRWEQERIVNTKLSAVLDQEETIARNLHQEALDPRDIDKVVSEIAAMVRHWSLFKLFIADINANALSSSGKQFVSDDEAHYSLSSTMAHKLFERLQIKFYIPLELRYLRCIIDKAHHLSEQNRIQGPIATTTPDDVFYVLKVVMKRLLSMGSTPTTKQTLEGLRDAMEYKYLNLMKKKIEESSGTLATSRTERLESRSSLATLNDLDVSISHLQQLVKDVVDDPYLYQGFDQGQQAAVKQHVSTFGSLKVRLLSVLKTGIETLFDQCLRPRLRNLISEVYKDVTYVLNDETYAAMEYHEIVRKRFARLWGSALEGYKETFTEHNYGLVFAIAVDSLLRPWEKMITSLKYNELGAIRFDSDLRSIISYLSSQIALGDVREKFVRLQQISILLNLDGEEDVADFYNGSGIPWRLSLHEAKTVIGLRV